MGSAAFSRVEAAGDTFQNVSLVELADLYMAVKAEQHTPITKKGHRYGRKLLARYCDRPIGDITPQVAQAVYDRVLAAHGAHSANRMAKIARAAWQWALRRGNAPQMNPWRGLDRPKLRPRPLYFDAGWLPAMISIVDEATLDGLVRPTVGRFLALALASGARPWCELVTLRAEDVDLAAGAILIRKSKSQNPRIIPTAVLGSAGLAALEAQLELVGGTGWLWPSPTMPGRVMSRRPPRDAWRVILARAAERGLRTETLDGKPLDLYAASRHAVANFAVSQLGLPVAHVAAILGHRSKECLETYAHLSVSHASQTAAALGSAYDEARIGGGGDAWGVDPAALRQAREHARLTQPQLAAVVGTSKQVVSKWEHGKSEPSVAQLHRIAAHLRRPITDFLYRQRGAA